VKHIPFVRRLLTLAVALPLAAVVPVVTAPAAHASASDYCPSDGSVKLLTANGGAEKLWLYNGAETYICFKAASLVGGRITLRSAVVPNIVPLPAVDASYASCPALFTVEDPVQFVVALMLQTTSPYSICFGVANGQAIKLTYQDGEPWWHTLGIYLDASSTAGQAWCAEVDTLYDTYGIDLGHYSCESQVDDTVQLLWIDG
jgi:hypothetical protein